MSSLYRPSRAHAKPQRPTSHADAEPAIKSIHTVCRSFGALTVNPNSPEATANIEPFFDAKNSANHGGKSSPAKSDHTFTITGLAEVCLHDIMRQIVSFRMRLLFRRREYALAVARSDGRSCGRHLAGGGVPGA
jgi:hypothetical protein